MPEALAKSGRVFLDGRFFHILLILLGLGFIILRDFF
jgi:hypothetical protein